MSPGTFVWTTSKRGTLFPLLLNYHNGGLRGWRPSWHLRGYLSYSEVNLGGCRAERWRETSPDAWSQYLHSTSALLLVEVFCSFSLKWKSFWFLIPKRLSCSASGNVPDNGANLCLRWEASGPRWVRIGYTWAESLCKGGDDIRFLSILVATPPSPPSPSPTFWKM